jgi:CRP-like cAMP-binding protein
MRIKYTRKARFHAALARVEMTQGEWAEQNDLTREHLNRVLNDRVDGSVDVIGKIDAFIADVEAKVLAA